MATTLTTTTTSSTSTVQQEIMPATTLNADNKVIPVIPSNKTDSNIVPIDVEQQPASTRHSKAQLSVIVTALWFSVFLAALDSTITTTALPTITQHFQSSAGYTWVGSAYLLATAASTPTWGKFSDIWGRKPIILAAVSVFFVGSLICGVSTSIFMLIGGRAVQGIGGGGVLTLVNICQSDLFSMRTRVLIFGFESLIWAAAAALGPVLGGVFSETLSWRWCFYINLPAAAFAFIILFFFLNLKTPATPLIAGLKAIDWLGSLAIIGTTISVLLGLEFGGVIFAWSSAKVLCLIIFGCVMGGLFLYNEAKVARYPVMPLKLFRHRNNIAAIAVGFLHSLAYISASYYMPLYTQAVRGYSPLQSGISLLPFALAIPISSAITGPIIRSTGRYLEFIWIGLTIMTLGFSLCTRLNSHSSNAKIIIYQILCGVGAGTAYTPPLIALQTSISSKDNATATSTFGFIRNLATAISVVLGGVVFQNGMESQTSKLIAALGPEIASQLSGKEAAANVLLINGLGDMQKAVAREAYSKSLGKMWIMYACFSGASLVASLFLKKTVLSKVHEEVRTGLESEEIKRLELRELDPRRTRVG